MKQSEPTFGERVRALREGKRIGLRTFAERVGLSATYLSRIERGGFLPPAEEKVRAIARALDQDEDDFLALAGRLPSDVSDIIRQQPREMAAFLRTAQGLPSSQIKDLTKQAAEMKRLVQRRPGFSGEDDEANERGV